MVKPLTLLQLEPEGRILMLANGEAEQDKVVRPLKITNASESNVAWKVRTDAAEAFLVKPRSGVLAAGLSVDVEITRLVGPSEGLTSNPKFEIRAVPVEADCECFAREDWSLLRASTQEAGYMLAVIRTPGSFRSASVAVGGGGASSAISADLGRPDGEDVSLGDDSGGVARRRGINGHSADSDAVGANRWRPDDDDGFDFRGGASSGRASGAGAHARRSAAAPSSGDRRLTNGPKVSGESGDSVENGSETETQKMGNTTKAILGLLIMIMFYNLYLRPLVQAMADGGEPAASSHNAAP